MLVIEKESNDYHFLLMNMKMRNGKSCLTTMPVQQTQKKTFRIKRTYFIRKCSEKMYSWNLLMKIT